MNAAIDRSWFCLPLNPFPRCNKVTKKAGYGGSDTYKTMLLNLFCIVYILVQSSNRSARITSIFQKTQNSTKSENSDNKTGAYSSFKITKT